MASRWNILLTAYKHYRAYKKFIRLDATAREKSEAPARLVADILKLGPTYIWSIEEMYVAGSEAACFKWKVEPQNIKA